MKIYNQGAREGGGQWIEKYKLLRGDIREEERFWLNQLNRILTEDRPG